MDARFVGKCVLPNDRLVPLHVHAGDARNEAAGGEQFLGVDIRCEAEGILAYFQRHHHFFQRRIAGPFTQPVDGALHLSRASFDGGETVGNRQAEIVVAVTTNHRIVNVRHVLLQVLDDVPKMRRHGVADGVGNVDRGCTGGDRLFDHFAEEIEFSPRGIFGRELNVRAIVDRSCDHLDRPFDNLFLVHLQLVFAMDCGCREKDMYPFLFGVLERFPGAINVVFATTSQPANDRAVAEFAGNFLHGLKITRRCDGKTGLNHIDAQLDQRFGNVELLGRVHATAGRLLAIAQCGIENRNRFSRHSGLQRWWVESLSTLLFKQKNPETFEVSGFCNSENKQPECEPLRPPASE